jgi:large subunit ribosomal protein L7/L12
LSGAFFAPPVVKAPSSYAVAANGPVYASAVDMQMPMMPYQQKPSSSSWLLPLSAGIAAGSMVALAVSSRAKPVAALAVSAEARPSEKVERLADEMGTLTLLEAADLVEKLQDMFGLPDQMPMGMPMGGMPAAGGGAAAPVEDAKTTVDVKITAMDSAQKIKLIKEIRTILGLGLKESKEFVEGLPKVLKEDIEKDEAEALKATIEGAGGTVELV